MWLITGVSGMHSGLVERARRSSMNLTIALVSSSGVFGFNGSL